MVTGGGLCGGSSSSGPGFWILDLGHSFGFWFWISTVHSGKTLTVEYLGHEDSGTAAKNGQHGGTGTAVQLYIHLTTGMVTSQAVRKEKRKKRACPPKKIENQENL